MTNESVSLRDAIDMTEKFIPRGDWRIEPIAFWMVATGACVAHAAWELYGRDKGLGCRCAPCLAEPQFGEFDLRIVVQGVPFEENT